MGTTCICYIEMMTPSGRAYCMGSLHLQKDYHLFAALAGVRNGTWGMRVKPISSPRGLPNDASEEVKRAGTEYEGVYYGHSWISLQELLGFDWDQVVPHEAVIDMTEPGVREWLEKGDRSKAPPSYSHYVTAQGGLLAGRYREVAWTQILRTDLKNFLEGVLPYLEYIAMWNPQDVRIVFWLKD